MDQPVPDVSNADVERILERDFEDADQARFLIRKLECPESARTALACLKGANGNLQLLEGSVQEANRDFRDLIAAAEYPNYCQAGHRVQEMSKPELEALYAADFEQYMAWLRS